jgi:peptidoglycan/xylan/chitin deacetylase (PgdA/CDA1 family)
MRIPITMCHGVHPAAADNPRPFEQPQFERLMRIAAEMGFHSVNYDELAAWRAGEGSLPVRPIMIDFDHPFRSVAVECREVLDHYGFRGNLFVNTGMFDLIFGGVERPEFAGRIATWEELGELKEAGWHFGAHTVTHPDLSALSLEDPSGDRLRAELEECDAALHAHLGVVARDFAFTGTSWSSAAERVVQERYRFGRLWIVGSEYHVDGRVMRYADLVGVPGPDEEDGGPPHAARYITENSDPYRLPSMELERLVYEPEAFRRYLEGALAET